MRLWWRELYEKALADPNVGADKLLWGTDWGASLEFAYQPGRTPPSYPVQIRRNGLPTHQIDFWAGACARWPACASPRTT